MVKMREEFFEEELRIAKMISEGGPIAADYYSQNKNKRTAPEGNADHSGAGTDQSRGKTAQIEDGQTSAEK